MKKTQNSQQFDTNTRQINASKETQSLQNGINGLDLNQNMKNGKNSESLQLNTTVASTIQPLDANTTTNSGVTGNLTTVSGHNKMEGSQKNSNSEAKLFTFKDKIKLTQSDENAKKLNFTSNPEKMSFENKENVLSQNHQNVEELNEI